MNRFFPPLGIMEGLGGGEMLVVFVIILVLFGGDKLPEFARGAGKLIREFKKASSGVEDEFKRALEEDEHRKKIQPPAITSQLPPPANPAASRSETPATPNPPSATPPKMLPTADDDGAA